MKRYPSLNFFMIIAVSLLSLPAFAGDMEDRIASTAKSSYNFKTYLKDDKIDIDVKDNGEVILKGKVASSFHKSLAEATVADLPGVKTVSNRLEVKGDTTSEVSDTWITTKVKTALMVHRKVSGLKTEVDTKNGVVTLRGKVANMAQKDLTTWYANDIDGVRSVTNSMTVDSKLQTNYDKDRETALKTDVDDASVTAQVKATLVLHRSTHALNTQVKTDHGVVTIRGIAQNGAEKELVTKLVEDIPGVKDLHNEMSVASATKVN